ncbi:MAG: sigma-54-dependent Fis family transcriptional regulator [Bacteroidetes bacterium]|nr:sigma-54-dependent Fis family transcriptional regulator [Bacteroidota bacterium]
MNKTVLIIDDDKALQMLLARIISKEGFDVLTAGDARSGLKVLEKEKVMVVMSDVNLPDANGIELVQTIKTKYPFTEIIVITGYGTIADGVMAIKNGAFDYLVKGDDNTKIIPLINKAIEKSQLQARIDQLENKIIDKYGFDSIIGASPALEAAKGLAMKVAQTDATVLLLGETGAGKEVFAQAIHYASKRKNKPFVAVNCSTFGKELLESELFGHKAGSFTGATKDKQGLMEEASGGTIFLDEVGEMSIDLQAKMLRVLETQQFYKVGDSKPTTVDVRVITATNRDLQKEIEKGLFRADLFYRLSVFQITLPSLSERIQDIDLLTEHFLRMFADKMAISKPKVGRAFLDTLKKHSWKGNIRELRNVIERAIILCDGELRPEFLPMEFTYQESGTNSLVLEEVEKQHIKRVLNITKGNKAEAARVLDIGLNTLYRKIETFNL